MTAMSTVLTEQQNDLRDAVSDLMAKRCSEAQVRRLMADDSGYDADVWTELATMGLLGLTIPEEFGGAGTGAMELAVVSEQMGRVLLCAPYLSTAVLTPYLLLALGDPAECADALPRIAAGELRPDFGPLEVDPAKGVTLVAARPPLVAFNVELEPPAGLAAAKAIAAQLREGGEAGLPGLRAIGLELPARGGVAQVSMNIEDYRRLTLAEVVAAIGERAAVSEAELVGLAPRAAFDGWPEELLCRNRATLEDALGF